MGFTCRCRGDLRLFGGSRCRLGIDGLDAIFSLGCGFSFTLAFRGRSLRVITTILLVIIGLLLQVFTIFIQVALCCLLEGV